MPRHRLYYALKPYLPWRVRMAARRAWARRKRRSCGAVWPIDEAAARPPEGWAGWPGGAPFAFLLTHDVEGPAGAAKVRQLADLEMALGFRSSFNLVPEGSYAVDPALRAWLTGNGFEVGVHDLHHEGELYRSREAFRDSAGRINRHLRDWEARGFRSAFMHHELDWIHDLDIAYDASTFDTDPFEPQPEAAGTIFPFWVPPPADRPDRPGYLELPYTLPQDSTLFLVLGESSPEIWIRKLDWIARQGGMALVNVHPDYLQFPGEPPRPHTFPVAHYAAFLLYARERYADRCWRGLPGALAAALPRARELRRPRRPKRVCLVTYSFYECDTRVARYGEVLARRGDEVEVVALRSSPALPAEEMIDGCRVFRLQDRTIDEKSPFRFLSRLLRFFFRTSSWISRRHAQRPFDVVHVHNVPDFLVFAAWRPKLAGAGIVLDIHDIVPELFGSKFGVSARSPVMWGLKLMERASGAFADHVILANHLWLELYIRRSAPAAKVSVLLNYVDGRVFFPRRRQRADGRKIVMFPGSLQPHQGLDVAINAFPRVVAEVPEAELHIYGEGSAKPALIGQAARLGLNGHVKFFSFRPTSEIAGVMAEADVGVVPKRADSFGNEAYSTKILEFMSLGVPIVASSTRIDRYYFDDTVVRFFASGDSGALAGRLVEALRDPAAASPMVARASDYAVRNSWESHQADYLALVDRLSPAP